MAPPTSLLVPDPTTKRGVCLKILLAANQCVQRGRFTALRDPVLADWVQALCLEVSLLRSGEVPESQMALPHCPRAPTIHLAAGARLGFFGASSQRGLRACQRHTPAGGHGRRTWKQKLTALSRRQPHPDAQKPDVERTLSSGEPCHSRQLARNP